MSSPPTLKERSLPNVSEIAAKTAIAGGLDVRARRLDNGLCCLTKDAAVQLHRGTCSFFAGLHRGAKAGI